MTINDQDDVHALTARLAAHCTRAGLNATVIAPTRVHISAPGAHSGLAETIRCEPDAEENLVWRWSWGEDICPALQITDAVKIIAYIVTPAFPAK
jgi:hypothetical protein